MRFGDRRVTLLGGSALALIVSSTPAFAQTAAGTTASPEAQQSSPPLSGPSSAGQPDPAVGGDIIVTAQKRSERLNDVPLSITAATGEQLLKAGITDTSQLVKIVPGFTFQLSQFGTPVYGIRGVSFFDTSGTASPAVSVYVDQVPLPLSILTRGAALDPERVEVLKGPQGTLFGVNATGGAVNYIAAKPTTHFTAGADLTLGRFDQVEGGGYVGGPISDTLSFRVSGRTEQRGDWQYSTSRDDGNGKRNLTIGRLLLDWTPASDLRFELNLNGWHDRSQTQANQFVEYAPTIPNGYAPAIAYLSAYNQIPRNARAANWDPGLDLRLNDNFFQSYLRGDWDVNSAATITSLSNYIHFRSRRPYDPDGTDYADLQGNSRDAIDTFSQELRLALKTGPVSSIIGGYYEHDTLDESNVTYLNGTNAVVAGVRTVANAPKTLQRVNTYAAFGAATYDLGGGFSLQGSARFTKEDRQYRGCTADAGDGSFAAAFSNISSGFSGSPTTIAPGGCATLDSATFKPAGLIARDPQTTNFAWRTSLNYKPSRDILLYANVTKGYKAGGFSNLPIALTNQLISVKQESVLAYEAGTKLTLLHNTVQASAAAFYYDYKDKQIQGYVFIPPFGNLPALVNVPKSSVRGGEVNVAWLPVQQLRIAGSATYVDARVDNSYATVNPFGTGVDVKGEQLPNSPKWQVEGDVDYTFGSPGSVRPFVGASVNYQSRSFAVFGENAEFRLPARTLVDLRAGLESAHGNWRAQIFARNVTNAYYWVNVSRSLDTVTRLAALPATYGVTLSYRY